MASKDSLYWSSLEYDDANTPEPENKFDLYAGIPSGSQEVFLQSGAYGNLLVRKLNEFRFSDERFKVVFAAPYASDPALVVKALEDYSSFVNDILEKHRAILRCTGNSVSSALLAARVEAQNEK